MIRKVSLFGPDGHYHGSLHEQGQLTVYDPNGNQLQGMIDNNGNINLQGDDGIYHGKLSGNKISIYSPNGDNITGTIS
ncbi:MAG TPA: hypothetical protein ENJ27_00850 [Candidatus Moranbacteria bacterium]|nr:hypothetical protein [Candidatus Moranbacteria bacterium]